MPKWIFVRYSVVCCAQVEINICSRYFLIFVGRKDVVKEHLCEWPLYVNSLFSMRLLHWWGHVIAVCCWGLLFELAALFFLFLFFPLFGFREPMIGFHFCLHLMKRKSFFFLRAKLKIERNEMSVCVLMFYICLSIWSIC